MDSRESADSFWGTSHNSQLLRDSSSSCCSGSRCCQPPLSRSLQVGMHLVLLCSLAPASCLLPPAAPVLELRGSTAGRCSSAALQAGEVGQADQFRPSSPWSSSRSSCLPFRECAGS
jgi:hypothetical protein